MLEVQVKSRDVELTPEIHGYINEQLERLDRFWERILMTRVLVEAPTAHHRQGGPFAVGIEVDVPGQLISVSRQADDDLHVAIRESVDAAVRQLEDYVRKDVRHKVKTHEVPLVGQVARIFPDEGYGFIETADGREVYFHRNAVRGNRFNVLKPGERVEFRDEPGEKGPQATFVDVA